MNFNKEKDIAKKLAYYQDYIAKYPPTADNKRLIDNFKSQLANAYAKAKDYKAYSEWNSHSTKQQWQPMITILPGEWRKLMKVLKTQKKCLHLQLLMQKQKC
ncbi:MAG: hypothetical protein WDM90_15420 [Ferruginibacter sp.]